MRTAASVLDAAERRLAPWRRPRCRIFDLQLDVEVAEVRQRLEAARARTRRHDLMNAFTAVEGAATILTQETLSPSDRSKLARLLGSGMRHVRELQFAEPAEGPAALGELIDSLSEEPDWPALVEVDVAGDLMVAGPRDEMAETIRQVLEHAGGRCPGSALAVRGCRRGARTELWVDDQGPRLTARERREVREPGCGRLFGPIHVGPLHVAVRLARGQGGHVRVEPRPGGGESFGISWPAPDGDPIG